MVNIISTIREWITDDGTWAFDENGLPYLTSPITAVNLTNIAYQTQYTMRATADKDIFASSPDLPGEIELRHDSYPVYDAFTNLPKNMRASSEIQLNGRPGWTQLSNFAFVYEDTSIVYPSYYEEYQKVIGIICLTAYKEFLFDAGLTWKGNLDGTDVMAYKEKVSPDYPGITQATLNEHECVYRSCIYTRKLDYCITYVENAMQTKRRKMERLWSMSDDE